MTTRAERRRAAKLYDRAMRKLFDRGRGYTPLTWALMKERNGYSLSLAERYLLGAKVA